MRRRSLSQEEVELRESMLECETIEEAYYIIYDYFDAKTKVNGIAYDDDYIQPYITDVLRLA